jgi:ATP-binding cassette subfamily B protein
MVDGFDLRDVRLGSLREHLGIVPQDPHLFLGTIHENIALGRPDATLERVMEAAKAAQIHEFVMGMPSRYETQVGERGQNLSGGQRQRLAIARALIQDPDLLIFDEATSHLDTESERLIQGSLRDILKDRTCVIVAHRLSTIRNADLILVFHEGKIAEQGNHDELLAKQGIYHRLWSNQMQTT